MKAYASAGLKYPVVTGETGGDDALLKSFSEEAIGLVSCTPYSLDLDNGGNNRLVIEGMLKNYDTVPGQYAALLYVSCQVVDAGLKAVGGDASDKEKTHGRACAPSTSPTRRVGRSSSITSAISSAPSMSGAAAPRAPNTV